MTLGSAVGPAPSRAARPESPAKAPGVAARLLRGGIAGLVSRLSGALMTMGAFALLARMLPPAAFGAFTVAAALATFGAVVAALGLENTTIRLVAAGLARGEMLGIRETARSAVELTVIGGAALGGLLLLVRAPLLEGLLHQPLLSAHAGWLALWTAALAVELTLSAALRGVHQLGTASAFVAGAVRSALLLLALAALQLTVGVSLRTALATAAVTVGASAVMAAVATRRAYRRLAEGGSHGPATPRSSRYRSLLRQSWPLMGSTVLAYGFAQADLWFVSAYGTPEEVAIYGSVLRLMLVATLPLMVINSTVSSTISELHERGERHRLERALRLLATLAAGPTLIVVLGFVLAGPLVLGAVFGDFYTHGASILAILGLGQLVNVWTGSCGTAMMMTGHQRVQLVLTSGSMAFLVTGALVAGPRWGMTGIAVVSALTVALNNVITAFLVHRLAGFHTHTFLAPAGARAAAREWLNSRRGAALPSATVS